MGSLISILNVVGPLMTQLTGILVQAMAANASHDQAQLDALDAQARAMADALKPAGA